MAPNQFLMLFLIALLSTFLFSPTLATTDLLDVVALQGLYESLNKPAQLTAWKSSGSSDPCSENWMGISCSGTSVFSINIRGLDLHGMLGIQLSNLLSLKELDLSFNSLQGTIPFNLPPNVTNINLAFNQFSQSITFSLVFLKYLSNLNLSYNSFSGPIGNEFTGLTNMKYLDLSYNNFTGDLPSSFSSLTNLIGLNLSHNSFSGPLGNIFTGLTKINYLDLSYNNFTGNLPSSFSSMTNLTRLYLQNNHFNGSVNFLSNLPLSELNIQKNHFGGVLPWQFNNIPYLSVEGNIFVPFPINRSPRYLNPVNATSTCNASSPQPPEMEPGGALKNYPYRSLRPGIIVFTVCATISIFACAAILVRKRCLNLACYPRISRKSNDESSTASLTLPLQRPIPSVRRARSSRITEKIILPMPSRASITTRNYTFTDLQLYTNNFSKENLLGESSIGSVYKGCFPKGRDFVVKTINMVELHVPEEGQFQNVIFTMSGLRHPNIVSLLGYCKEDPQCLLLYEYVGQHTLKDYLHCIGDIGPPLSWIARLNIGLGVARALEYLHWTCSPPIPHCNIKSGNVMLNKEGLPRLCDCGIALLITVKDKSSQLAVGSTGYTAPEHGKSGIDKTKTDVYEFGILMLELLTGKQPFDILRPREKKYLVTWASSHLHDMVLLNEMVDPKIRGSYLFLHLSQLAKIITLCIKPDPALRPSISEVAESLAHMLESKSSVCRAEDRLVEEATWHNFE